MIFLDFSAPDGHFHHVCILDLETVYECILTVYGRIPTVYECISIVYGCIRTCSIRIQMYTEYTGRTCPSGALKSRKISYFRWIFDLRSVTEMSTQELNPQKIFFGKISEWFGNISENHHLTPSELKIRIENVWR